MTVDFPLPWPGSCGYIFRLASPPHGVAVSSRPFHGCSTGSNPVGVTLSFLMLLTLADGRVDLERSFGRLAANGFLTWEECRGHDRPQIYSSLVSAKREALLLQGFGTISIIGVRPVIARSLRALVFAVSGARHGGVRMRTSGEVPVLLLIPEASLRLSLREGKDRFLHRVARA